MAAKRKTSPRPPELPIHFLDQSPLPMAMVQGITHILRYANPAFSELLGKTQAELIDQPLSVLMPKDLQCIGLIDSVLQTGRSTRHIEKHPTNAPLLWSYSIWPLVSDEPLVGILIEVSETTQTHNMTVAMNEALVLGSLRQQKLTQASAQLNNELRIDIEERKKIAQELAEKARLLDLSTDAIIVRDMEGHITYWNRGAENLYGWSVEEALGKNSHELFETEYPVSKSQMTDELFRTNHWTGELVHRRKDGIRINVLSRKTLDRDSEGNPAAMLQTITDITASKKAEAALLEAAEQFRFMAESMPQKIFTAKPNGALTYLNRQWLEFSGRTSEQMVDGGWLQCVHPDDIEETERIWKLSVKTGEYFELEHRLRRLDNVFRWHLTRAYAMMTAKGRITLWIGSCTDIDDMMKAQEELIDAETQLADRALQLEGLVARRTRELTVAHQQLLEEAEERERLEAEIAYAIEGERERLGQELHDGLVQELTGITMMLHVLAKTLVEPLPELSSEADRLCMMLEKAHGNARDLAKSFYPIELEQHGLLLALEGIADRTQQQYGVCCKVEQGENVSIAPKDATSVQLFRIAQEAVQNAAKHASAKTIIIQLSKHGGNWHLTVQDDGIGLPNEGPNNQGMGLRIMKYRAGIIQGNLSVNNHPDGGVLVSCTAPTDETR